MPIHEVFAAVAEFCRPYMLPGLWADMPCHPNFLELPEDRATIVQALREFPPAELLAAGVAAVADDETPTLSPQLAAAKSPLWPIRAGAGEPIANLIVDMRPLIGKVWTPALALQAWENLALLPQSHFRVVVASSMIDAAILISSGFPAVPITDFELMKRPRLDCLNQLANYVDVRRLDSADSTETDHQESCSCKLVVCNWSVEDLSSREMPAAAALWKHVMRLDGLDILHDGEFAQWRPLRALADLRAAVQFGDGRLVWTLLDDSMTEDATPPGERRSAEVANRSPSTESPDNSPAAPPIATDAGLPTGGSAAQDRSAAAPRSVDERLRAAAKDCEDAVQTGRLQALADLLALQQVAGEALRDRCEPARAVRAGRPAMPLEREELRIYLSLVDRSLSLGKEIERCRPRRFPRTRS